MLSMLRVELYISVAETTVNQSQDSRHVAQGRVITKGR